MRFKIDENLPIEVAELLRTAGHDALTVFDENGAWWDAPAVLRDALAARDWHALFIRHRDAWAQSQPVLFGHALLEKLEQPRKAITAHVWLVADVDSPADDMPPPMLLPLPVLGVPGWWPANDSPGFYRDRTVFRVPGIMAP
jgi:hypothetical protein